MATQKTILKDFKEKTEASIAKINNLERFRASDEMVDFVFLVGRELFSKPLDRIDTGWLIRHGGKLTGAYAYLGQKSSFARAERDIYLQKMEEIQNEITLNNYGAGSDSKITHAKAQAKWETAILADEVTAKDNSKNNYEHLVTACDKMISFIQSAIKVKENEQFRSKSMQDNG